MENKILKLFSVVVVLFLIANLTLFALKLISVLLFWIIIIIAAVVAYKVLPQIRK